MLVRTYAWIPSDDGNKYEKYSHFCGISEIGQLIPEMKINGKLRNTNSMMQSSRRYTRTENNIEYEMQAIRYGTIHARYVPNVDICGKVNILLTTTKKYVASTI